MTALRAIAIAVIIGLVGVLLVGIQQYRVISLQDEVKIKAKSKDDALAANAESHHDHYATRRSPAQRQLHGRPERAPQGQ